MCVQYREACVISPTMDDSRIARVARSLRPRSLDHPDPFVLLRRGNLTHNQKRLLLPEVVSGAQRMTPASSLTLVSDSVSHPTEGLVPVDHRFLRKGNTPATH